MSTTEPSKSPQPKDPNRSSESVVMNESRGHREELVDHYWGSINYIFSLIRASEIKAGLILSFYGILLNLIYQDISAVNSLAKEGYWIIYLPLGLGILCTVISIYYSIRCFMPKMEMKYDTNAFFFQDIITKFGDYRQFAKTFYTISLNEEELFDHLGQQIYINSKIASTKFKMVNQSIYFLAISLVIFFIGGTWFMFLQT